MTSRATRMLAKGSPQSILNCCTTVSCLSWKHGACSPLWSCFTGTEWKWMKLVTWFVNLPMISDDFMWFSTYWTCSDPYEYLEKVPRVFPFKSCLFTMPSDCTMVTIWPMPKAAIRRLPRTGLSKIKLQTTTGLISTTRSNNIQVLCVHTRCKITTIGVAPIQSSFNMIQHASLIFEVNKWNC